MILIIQAMRCKISRERGYLAYEFEPLSKPLYRDTNFEPKRLADIDVEVRRVADLVAAEHPGVTFLVLHFKPHDIHGKPNRSLPGYNKLPSRPYFVEPAKAAEAEGFEQ